MIDEDEDDLLPPDALARLSERSMGDWLRPEEDDAWAYLQEIGRDSDAISDGFISVMASQGDEGPPYSRLP